MLRRQKEEDRVATPKSLNSDPELISPRLREAQRERWNAASSYPIHAGWNVSVQLFYADDYAVVTLNGEPVLDIGFGEAEKAPVDLQNVLRDGDNFLRVVCWNYHPDFWSFRYKIGVFNEAHEPAMAAIDLSPKGTTPHYGIQHDVTYTFTKT
jgi:hypothetical protein